MLDHESVCGLRARAQALADGVREASAAAVVRRVFAIQAQDATAADLGIRVRGRDITATGIRAAYEDERSIVRSWYMRGTLHTIPGSYARWVLSKLVQSTVSPPERGRHHPHDSPHRQAAVPSRLGRRAGGGLSEPAVNQVVQQMSSANSRCRP